MWSISRLRWHRLAIAVILSLLFLFSATLAAFANEALTQISSDPYHPSGTGRNEKELQAQTPIMQPL